MTRFALSFALLATACGSADRTSPSIDGGYLGDGGGPDAGPTAVCQPASNSNPNGLKGITYLDSFDTAYPSANYRIAVETWTEVGVLEVADAAPFEAAVALDYGALGADLAGFLVSQPAQGPTALDESSRIQVAMQSILDGTTTRVSGSRITSLDGFDTVVGTTLEIVTPVPYNVAELRRLIIPALLGRQGADVVFPADTWTPTLDTRFVMVVQTLHRTEAGQTIYMGGLARASDYDDRTQPTALHSDDLANGSGLTTSANGEARECEDSLLDRAAVADIIWVIDESGSTSDDRMEIADNADAFFTKALDLGLDFRMAVTDMNDGNVGKFATRNADGSGERWILPNEPLEFASAIEDPSGPGAADSSNEHGLTQTQAAISSHLPRNASNPLMVRPDAKLAVVIVTDEKADEVEDAGILAEGNHEPTVEQSALITTLLAPLVTLFTEQQAIAHLIAEPLPFGTACSTGGAEHAFGYYELTSASGGQIGSICQLDLGVTLDAMLDSIVGDASPLELEFVPISASISVMRDGQPVPRSRQLGWDYRSSSNSIVFYGMPIDPAHPAEIVIGYRRWNEQIE